MKRAAAARAEFEPSVGAGKMGAKPMTASGTVLVDALHGPAGKILHKVVLRWPPSPVRGFPLGGEMNCNGGDFAPEGFWCQEKITTRYSGRVAVWKTRT